MDNLMCVTITERYGENAGGSEVAVYISNIPYYATLPYVKGKI